MSRCETCFGDRWISRDILVTFWPGTNKPKTKQPLTWDEARDLESKVDRKMQMVTSEALPCPACSGRGKQ